MHGVGFLAQGGSTSFTRRFFMRLVQAVHCQPPTLIKDLMSTLFFF